MTCAPRERCDVARRAAPARPDPAPALPSPAGVQLRRPRLHAAAPQAQCCQSEQRPGDPQLRRSACRPRARHRRCGRLHMAPGRWRSPQVAAHAAPQRATSEHRSSAALRTQRVPMLHFATLVQLPALERPCRRPSNPPARAAPSQRRRRRCCRPQRTSAGAPPLARSPHAHAARPGRSHVRPRQERSAVQSTRQPGPDADAPQRERRPPRMAARAEPAAGWRPALRR